MTSTPILNTDLEPEKQESINQWNNDPCGSSAGKHLEQGTREFYERIDQNRYEEYGPWMKSVMPLISSSTRICRACKP